MEFTFSESEEAFREEVRRFLQEELAGRWWGFYDRPRSDEEWAYARRFYRKLGERGWIGVTWPKEYGGLGRSFTEQLIIGEELGYWGAPYAEPGMLTVGPTLLMRGDEQQKREYLLKIARGEITVCLGYTEPDAGSDLASLETRAVKEGDNYIISGQKTFCTWAHRADFCWLVARTDPTLPKHRGISVFMVDMKTPGITIHPLIDLDGSYRMNEVFFEEVPVPAKNLVGGKNHGWEVISAALDIERAFMAGAHMPASCKRIIEEIAEHIKGLGLAKNPLIRQKLAELAIEIEVSRLLGFRISWMLNREMTPIYESSAAKVFTTELTQRLSNTIMQILGLYGQLRTGSKWAQWWGRAERMYQLNLMQTIGGGTNEIQRDLIAIRGLRLPR